MTLTTTVKFEEQRELSSRPNIQEIANQIAFSLASAKEAGCTFPDQVTLVLHPNDPYTLHSLVEWTQDAGS